MIVAIFRIGCKPVPTVRRVVFIAMPHRGSYLTEYPVTELLGRFLTLSVRLVRSAPNSRGILVTSR